MNDRPAELGDEDRKQQRANARDHINEAYNALQQAGKGLVGAHAEICDALGLTPGKDAAAAFSDLFVTMDRVYETIDNQLNASMAADQRSAAEQESKQ